jgi:ABC-type dipeptide/oligopeptide/nickel transport system ATPase subunit
VTLTAHGVEFAYSRDEPVLSDINLTAKDSEIIGLLGASGCGKSTLARCLTGLLSPTSGDICLDGEHLPARRTAQQRRSIQMVFQSPRDALDPRWTAIRSIAEPLRTANPDRRATELGAAVGLSERHLAARPAQLSGGQCQRVCIARALAADPRFLVADEAVSSLDASVQATVLELLLQVRRDFGVGIVFISHDLSVVRYLCDRICVMHDGRIVEQLAPGDRPRNPRTIELYDAEPHIVPRLRAASAPL